MRLLDLTGQRFGALVAVSRALPAGKQGRWLCKCDCGNESIVQIGNLRNGHTVSCGCRRSTATRESKLRHGKYGTPVHKSWSAMLSRCLNPKCPKYPDYGGRGILVCDAWRSFDAFFADMGERPAGTTLGRIDNDGNYEPSNCEWQAAAKQARNKRNTALFDFGGRQATLREHCELAGAHYPTIKSRIYLYGWSVDAALTTPVARRTA